MFATACGSEAPTPDGNNAEGVNAPLEGAITIQDSHNYLATSQLSIPVIETASATDLDICWTDVTSDLQCHGVAPGADVDNVALLRFLHLSEEQVEQRLTTGQLAQSEIDGYLEYNTDHQSTCAKLSSMSFFGTAIQVEEEYTASADHTYMLIFAEGTTPGVGARAMTFVKPTTSSTNTSVNATAGCGLLTFSADLEAATKLPIPAEGPWTVDWRSVTRDGQGNPIVVESIDGLRVGFYEGMNVSELEAQIFDLDLIATEVWEMPLRGGRTADLSLALARADGAPFAGFDPNREGVWILGLTCSTCQNPAPVVLSILDPGAAD